MQILPINIFNTQPNRISGRRSAGNVTFYGTSAGAPLRRLKGIKCAYFGIEMLESGDMTHIERMIDACTSTQQILKLLSKYKKHMLKVEKRIFKKFQELVKASPEMTLPDCLKSMYDEALIKLKLEEFNVLDDVDKISLKLSPASALDVHSKTTQCRQVILENNPENTFKRKTLLTSLEEIVPKKGESKVMELLNDRVTYLPTSGTSENAFVVKYASRGEQEIAKRLLRPAVKSVEHIHPDSLGGLNAIGNFILTCSAANSMRSNMPLPKFIAMFPRIPKYCQKYVEQIIEKIHKGLLNSYETYPYKIKKNLEKESKGKIVLDLSGYKYTKEEAKEKVRKHYSKQKH